MAQQQDNNFSGKTSNQGEVLKQQVFKYIHYWYWFVFSAFILVILAFLYLRYQPRVYSSNAKIQILNKKQGLEMPTSGFVFNRSNINLANEIEILRSYRIVEKVVKELDLTMEYYVEGNVRTTEVDRFPFKILKIVDNDSVNYANYFIEVNDGAFDIFKNSSETAIHVPNYNTYSIKHDLPFEIKVSNIESMKKYVGNTYLLKFIPVEAATKKLKRSIQISLVGNNSDLLNLTYTGENVIKLEKILNTLISIFNEDGINDRQEVSRRTIDFIDERFSYLAKELDSIEIEKKEFKQRNDLVTFETSVALEVDQRSESEYRVFEMENQIMLADLLDETLNSQDSISELLPANIGLESGNVNSLVEQYNQLIFERDRLGESALSNNPTVQMLNTKIKEVKSNINTSLKAFKNQLQSSKKSYEERNKIYSAQVSNLPKKEKLLRAIERQQSIKESLYLFLLQKREEAAINLAITEPSVKVVEYALSNSVPISPTPKNVYMTALVAGLIIPFGILYLIFLLNTKIKDKRDVETIAPEVPILAELPIIKDQHLVFLDPFDTSVQAEAFRILSSNVNYLIATKNRSKSIENEYGKVIYCTSTIKGEGKTYVALNLSLALSSLNKRVLLIGADLRNPQIHNYLTGSWNKNVDGLSNYLHNENFNWRTALIKGFEKHMHHDILLSGVIPPNPAQLLTNGRLEALLDEAKKEYDYVIVDTAPTILVTDTTVISDLADATLYLVRANFTEKNLLDFSRGLKHSGRLKNMAYVLNGVATSRTYGYNYGYNYGYGSSNS